MDVNEYIESGILELYIAGCLSEKENLEVYDAMSNHSEILDEVKSIENSIITLSAALSSKDTKVFFNYIKNKLNSNNTSKVVPISKPTNSWFTYTGWAAAVIVGGVLVWTLNEKNQLKESFATETEQNKQLEQKIEKSTTDLAEAEKLITIFRDKNVISVPLSGQVVAPNAYAKVYVDKKTNSVYLDAKGLPEPPKGKVYQVWSLTLSPLTPTSMGTIEDFKIDDDKIFKFDAIKGTEGWGITLEPAGGSETPTLEQLYTLGTIAS